MIELSLQHHWYPFCDQSNNLKPASQRFSAAASFVKSRNSVVDNSTKQLYNPVPNLRALYIRPSAKDTRLSDSAAQMRLVLSNLQSLFLEKTELPSVLPSRLLRLGLQKMDFISFDSCQTITNLRTLYLTSVAINETNFSVSLKSMQNLYEIVLASIRPSNVSAEARGHMTLPIDVLATLPSLRVCETDTFFFLSFFLLLIF